MLRSVLPALALAFALAGCAGRPDPAVEPGLLRVFEFRIQGKTYLVSRTAGPGNRFRARLAGAGNGNRRAMWLALRRAYGCHALELTEIKPVWREAEARGVRCTGGYQRFEPGR